MGSVADGSSFHLLANRGHRPGEQPGGGDEAAIGDIEGRSVSLIFIKVEIGLNAKKIGY